MKFNVSQEIREVVRELLPSGDTSASSVAARLRVKFPTSKKIRETIENKAYFSVSISTAKKKVLSELESDEDATGLGTGKNQAEVGSYGQPDGPTSMAEQKMWMHQFSLLSTNFEIVRDEYLRVTLRPKTEAMTLAGCLWVDLAGKIGEENARIALNMIG